MEAVQIKKAWKAVKVRAKVAFRGFCRALYGAMVVGLFAVAIYGLANINNENGWTAVCDFVVSVATVFVALFAMYVMGGRKAGASS